MKKFTKVLSLFVVLFALVFALTSCGEKQSIDPNKFEVQINSVVSSEGINIVKLTEWIAEGNKAEDFKEVTYLGLFDSQNGILYLEGAQIKAGTYVLVERGNGLPALDKEGKGFFGPYFAGWYGNEGLRNDGARLVTFTEFSADADHIVYAYYIDFVQAILVAVVCILIVFSMLLLLWGLVSLLKFTAPKQKQAKTVEAPAAPAQAPRKAISLADIKDEEMMAAALVATIDYHEETQEDVRVVSIKEIK